jgi:protein-disulfide isomerase
MKKNLGKRILVLFLMIFSVVSAHGGEITINEEQLRNIIQQVIKDNPKLIYDTVNQYVREQRTQQQKQQLENSFKNRVKDVIEAHNPTKGPADAAVTIIEYTDFECPYCAKGAETMKQLTELYPDKIRVVFKNLPLKMHNQALPAAKAALAAQNQGKFWEYHDLLFQNSDELQEETLVKLAKDLQLDMAKFNADRQSETIAQFVAKDMEQAEQHKLTGTPAFIANGVVIRGAKPVDSFVQVIERLLEEQK